MGAATHKRIVRVLAAAFLSLLFVLPLAPAVLRADTAAVHSVNITVELAHDGSARFTEQWDVTITDGTEYYLAHPNLDNMAISNLKVSENGAVFEDVGQWDSSGTREQKAGKSGILEAEGGYELCWGFGTTGRHQYSVEYTVTNLVKGYEDADGLRYAFVNKNGLPPEELNITLKAKDFALTQQNAGVWVFRYGAKATFENGAIEIRSTQPMQQGHEAYVMAEFNKGTFLPEDQRNESFEELKQKAFEGSDYAEEGEFPRSAAIGIVVGVFGFLLFVLVFTRLSPSRQKRQRMKPEYRNVPYSRTLPFGGSLPASYARLNDLGQLENDSVIIGAYLLRWLRSGQVEIVKQLAGVFQNKEEDAIRLYAPNPGMEQLELALYNMLVSAAGPDQILQSKEFEKWSRQYYSSVQGWLTQYQNTGMAVMRQMNAVTDVQAKAFFGLTSVRRTVATELGEKLTVEMFGFKKYLTDFTIINERQAREVQLWEEYLVFAQLFGIADTVATQFNQLYPDYFRQMGVETAGGLSGYDIFVITRIAGHYSRAMHTGYRAGFNAEHSTRYTGGGGFSSFGGGGGGFSGGGGGHGSR